MSSESHSSLAAGEPSSPAERRNQTTLSDAVPDSGQPSFATTLPAVAAGRGTGPGLSDDAVLPVALPLAAANREGDEWVIPDRILGPMLDEFFGAVGGVVTLSALLEDRLRVLLQTSTFAPQTGYARDSPARLISNLRRYIARLPDDGANVAAYLDDIRVALDRRNELVHSLWGSSQLRV